MLGAVEISIDYPAGSFDFVSFTRGSDWLQGTAVYNQESPLSSFSFGGLIGSLNNPGRLHLGDLTLRANTMGIHSVITNINLLSERSTNVVEIGSKVGLSSSSTPHAIVVTSSRRSTENTFFPVQSRSKRTLHLSALGDINIDGVFDLNDAQFLQLSLIDLLVNPTSLTEIQLQLADLDLNGAINTNDVAYLINVNFGILPFISEFLVRPADDPSSNCVLTVGMSASDRDGNPVTSGLAIYALFLSNDANFHTEYDLMSLAFGQKVNTQLGNPSNGKWVLLDTNPNVTEGYLLQTELNNISSTDIGLAFHLDYKPDAISNTIFLSGIQNANSQLYDSISDSILPPTPFSQTFIDQTIDFTPLRIFDNTIKEYECFNYFPPLFDSPIYEVSQALPEDHPINSVIATVSATDLDTNINGVIEYSIDNINYNTLIPNAVVYTQPVEVLASNGEVYVTSQLDRDVYSSFDVVILAIDQGPHLSARRTATTTVQVLTIVDINDNAPEITGVLSFNIPENAALTTQIGAISAIDRDATSPNNLVFFSAVGNSDPFFVSSTGKITISTLIDSDNGNPLQYIFAVVVSDSAVVNRLSVEVNITVDIIDVNDLGPEFLPPFYIDVPESISAGTVIGRIQARDNDTNPSNAQFDLSLISVKPLDGDKNVLNYQLLSDNIFSIDANGTLTIEQVCYHFILFYPLFTMWLVQFCYSSDSQTFRSCAPSHRP